MKTSPHPFRHALVVVVCALCLAQTAFAIRTPSTIDPTNRFSYGANIGFMDWRPETGDGIVIGRYINFGWIYSANVGWIRMSYAFYAADGIRFSNTSAEDWGVNTYKDPSSPGELYLRGFAYGANIGWINFENTGNPRIMLSNGRLRGYAWSANCGWINLDDLNFYVQTDTIDPGDDSDHDGIADAYELIYFGDLSHDGSADSDGDGEDDLSEYRSDTNPIDAVSVVRSARAVNISTRGRVLTGDRVMIGGFIVTGTEPKRVIVRGIGPSLTALGVPDSLNDPTLELFNSSGLSVGFNNNWRDSNAAEIAGTGVAPTDDREPAIVQTLLPGMYTAVLAGNGGATGVAVVEAYDLGSAQPTKLANISTRAFVQTGDNIMIGGFIVGAGAGTSGRGSARFVVRAIGPSLADAGVPEALQDPFLELRNGNGDLVAANDNWRDTQQAEIEGTGLAPHDTRESAIVGVIGAGAYTALVRGADDGSGVGLVEIYNLP